MAELGLAIVGTVDLCLKWGHRLVNLCKSCRNADEEIKERADHLALNWHRTQQLLEFMKKISSELTGPQRYHQLQIMGQLQSHFKTACEKLNECSETKEEGEGRFRRFLRQPLHLKYALFKQGIDKAIEDLDKWHRTADPSWFLILRMSSLLVDRAIAHNNSSITTAFPAAKHIRSTIKQRGNRNSTYSLLPAKYLDGYDKSDILLSTAKTGQRISASRGPQNVILTTLQCYPGANVDLMTNSALQMAEKLTVDDPKAFGLLSCKGVVKCAKSAAPTTFTMVWRSPGNRSDASSLRQKLLSNSSVIERKVRVRFARQLANAIAYVHNFGFVHKAVRPESILVYPGMTSSSAPTVYLAGFDNFRAQVSLSPRRPLNDWESEHILYLHPSRRGTPREDYRIQHDIYSLGVCLLEIGLWKSFVKYQYDAKGANQEISYWFATFASSCRKTGSGKITTKDVFVQLCQDCLPEKMGSSYTKIVETCLTCLDSGPGNIDFGDVLKFADDDGIPVGVRFIEKV
ncbi:hypothetical protein FZEAL_9445 [Fusarium zealandicum]|uniref:Protein kinase domain-containing protein n=1 Tax=Fusarium zealandicum TaxID=1053134 RepID=A0A8H4UB73_9HYPO|nr:hypothetical protein FZEAL_9445 [Fusarium zealandicum]